MTLEQSLQSKIKSFLYFIIVVAICGFALFSYLKPARSIGMTVRWVGANNGEWGTAGNWDVGMVPTSTSDVIITSSTAITVNVNNTTTASFGTLQIGGTTGTVAMVLTGNIGTGGDITIASSGTLRQANSSTQSISGTLLIQSNGKLEHTANIAAYLYKVDFSAATLTVNAGGSINVDGKGYVGTSGAGNGPARGTTNGGGGHGGNGGTYSGAGGIANCDISNPATIGSSGAASGGYSSGGAGGGLIKLNISGTLTVNGTITADGADGVGGANYSTAGGGAGGGISIVADTIAGTPQSFTITGGNKGSSAGGGGGGCAYLGFTTSNSISPAASYFSLYGGSGTTQHGGAGLALVKQVSTNGTLFVKNNGTAGALTSQVGSATYDSVTLLNQAVYSVTSTLILSSSTPFEGSSNATFSAQASSTLTFADTVSFGATNTIFNFIGRFTPITTMNVSSGTVNMYSTVTGTVANLTLGSGTNVTTMNLVNFTTTTPLTLFSNLTIKNSGTLSHSANGSTQTQVINISATTLIVDSGGSINVDGKGYVGTSGAGIGPAGGQYGGGGGGHGGNGGTYGGAGGIANCDISNPVTIGSSGAANGNGYSSGGAGGGLIKLNISGTLTVNGTITADGADGVGGANYSTAGGGAGGGINIVADTIAGTPQSFTITGGNKGSSAAGAGGGCAYIGFTTTNSVSSTAAYFNMSGGAGYSAASYGGAGLTLIKQVGQNGDLYIINSGTAGGAQTPQVTSSLTVDTISIRNQASYVVSSKQLALAGANPFGQTSTGTFSSNTSTITFASSTVINIADGTVTFGAGTVISPLTSLTIGKGTVSFASGVTGTIAALIIGDGTNSTTMNLQSYTTSSPFDLATTITVANNGTLTHSANASTQASVLHISATTLTVASGGSINVDGKGYAGTSGAGNGPAKGTTNGGGGHGGNGGTYSGAGGIANCDISNPATIGSSGAASGGYSSGGAGGGLIKLNISGTLTVNGTITADGADGVGGANYSTAGGGAGGGINIVADTIAGTPQSFTITGGNKGSSAAGAGGGCAYIGFTTTNSVSSTAAYFNMSGGTGINAGANGGVGSFVSIQSTPSAPATLYSADSSAQSGATNPTNLTVTSPVFSAICNTPSGQCTSAAIEVDDNSDFSSPYWQSGQVSMTGVDNAVRSGNISYTGTALHYNTSYYWRIKFYNVNGAGNWSTETATLYAPRTLELFTFNDGGVVQGGQVLPIMWGSLGGGNSETVKIEYSTSNDFSSPTTIVVSTSTPASTSTINIYNWTVPSISNSNMTIRISTNNDGNSYGVTSSYPFTIQADAANGYRAGRTFSTSSFYTVSSTANVVFSNGNAVYAAAAASSWYNVSWTRRKQIVVTNNSSTALTNIQVRVTSTYDSDMQADFDDIRFTSSDGTTLIDSWLEAKSDSSSSTFWVEVPTISGSATTSVYMYYGNNVVASSSSMENTFLASDDFNDGSISANWTTTAGNGTITESAGVINFNYTGASANDWWSSGREGAILKLNSLPAGDWHAQIKLNSFTIALNQHAGIAVYGSDTSAYMWGRFYNANYNNYNMDKTGTQYVAQLANTALPKYLGIRRVGSTYSVWSSPDNTTWTQSGSTYSDVTFNNIALFGKEFGSNNLVFTEDDFYIRKWVATDPSISIGAEAVYAAATTDDQTIIFNAGHTYSSISSFGATTTVTGNGAVKFQVSSDNGATWKYCVGNVLTAAGSTSSTANTAAQVTDTCLASLTTAGTFNVRSFLSANSGDSATLSSVSFQIGTNNAPTADSLSATQLHDGSGYIPISIALTDLDLNDIKLKTEYKSGACSYSGQVTSTILNGSNISATYSSSSIIHSNAATGGYQLSTISTLTGTNTVQYTWDTLTDVPAANGTYCLFVTPNDGAIDGTTVSTTVVLDNVAPTAPGNLTINTTSTQSVTFAFGTASTETNFREYKIFYKLGSSGVTTADTAFTSSTDSDLSSLTFNGTATTTLSSLATSTQYVAKIFAYDTYSNSSTSAGEIAFYTLAAAPSAPTVTASTTAALTLVVVPGSNPTGSTVTYSICKTTNGTTCDASGYVQADGSLGAIAAWQTYTAWGGTTGLSVTGLSANTGYQFLVQARNGDSIETAFSTANSAAYTLANPVTSVTVVNATVTSSLRATLSWTTAGQTGIKIERDNGCDGSYDVTVYDNATTNETSPTTTQANFTANTCYQFRFASYNQQGVINTISYGVSNQLTMPPGQPQNLTPSSVASTSINWAWNSVTGATSYVLYNYLTNSTVTTTASTSFAHADLTPNTSYQVAVRAVNSNGTGIASSPASTITDAQAPTGLTAVSGTKSVSSIRWTWTNGGQSAFFARDKNNTADNSGWITDTFWNQSILSANTQYTLQVRARNTDLVETSNSEISAYTLQNPPTGVTFSSVNPTSLVVTAGGSFPNIGSDSSVIHFSNGAGTAIDINDGPNWTNTGLTPNTQYTYTVYATNGNNDQTASAQGSKYTAANVPAGFTGTTDPRSAVLSWSHNSNAVSTEYYLTAEGATSQNSGWITGTGHTFSNLTAGAWYTFTIKARNAESLESAATSITLRVQLLPAYSPPLESEPTPVTIVSSTTATTTSDTTGAVSGGGSGAGSSGGFVPTSTPPNATVVVVPPFFALPVTVPSQVAFLAAQLGSGTYVTKYSSFFTTYLYPSRSSKDIVYLQQFLKDLGFFTYGKTTGFFGSATVKALNMFQKAGAVQVVPYADGQTMQLVNSILSAPAILNTSSPEIVHPLVNTLCRGAKGPEVIELQTFLKKSGFFTAAYLANFGQATDKALRSFQKANKLKVTGCTDQTTRAKVFSLLAGTTTVSVVPEVKDVKVASGRFGGAIFATIRTNKGNNICYGAVSPAVTNLQALLHERGYLKEKPTGHFGYKTRSAVKKLQQERKVTPVNGCVGPKTLEIMERL